MKHYKGMKKNCFYGRGVPFYLKKCLLVMKLCMLLMVVLHFGVSASGYAQQRVSLSMQNVTLEQVIKELKRQTGLRFFYSVEKVRNEQKKVVEIKDDVLDDALREVLRGTGLTFTIMNDVVVIKDELVVARDSVPPLEIKGVVRDKAGVPLPGVTVLLKGWNTGVATDKDGKFRLSVLDTSNVVLFFSFVGMQKVEYKYKGETNVNITMEEDVKTLEDVIVTGYGNVTKGNYTGASTTVKAADIMIAGASSIDQMLQGVIPGMLVMNKTGMVGATPKIRVRGTSTLLGSQEPVWVVDGVIQQDPQPFNSEDNTKFSVDADDIRQLAGNAISWLNPNDIETITVLKDASATAIYGSKAANGVIVITTKKALAGKVLVNYSGDFTIGQRPRYGLYDLMNSAELMQFQKDIYDERVSYRTPILYIGYAGLLHKRINKEITLEEMNREYLKMSRQNTDWFDILFRNSFSHSHSLSVSGGSEKIMNRTSFGFRQNKGEAKGNTETLFTATSNTTVRLWNCLTIDMLLKGSIREVDGFAYGVDPYNYAYNTSRIISAYNEDGTLFYHETWGSRSNATGQSRYNYNILNELNNTGSKNNTRTWGMTFNLKWQILSDLEYQGMVAYTSSSTDTKQYATELSNYITKIRGYEYGSVAADSKEATEWTPLPNGGLLETNLTNTSTIMVRNSLVYDRLFQDKHRVTLQLGVETNAVKVQGNINKRYGYLRDRGETFTTPPATYGHYIASSVYDNSEITRGDTKIQNRKDNKLSGYGLAVYTYNSRYVLNCSVRWDASNRFGQNKNKRFEPTWSVGLKWRVKSEKFAENLWWLNNLDIYGSYGYQGNAVESVSPYLIAQDGGMNDRYQAFVLNVKSLPYPDLGWEKTRTYNVGMDASFLRGRLNFNINYFEKISDVLSSRDIPYENGMVNAVVSGSTMKNYGYDFVINIVPVQVKNFTWQLSLNTSVTRNKVTKNDRVNTLNDYLDGSSVVDGEPYSTFYSYRFSGLDSENGTPLFEKIDEDGLEIIDYLTKSGKFTPDFSGGLNTMFKYKDFTLYALFAIQWGGHSRLPELYQNVGIYRGLPFPEENMSRKLTHRWRNSGDESNTNIPSLPGRGSTNITLPLMQGVASRVEINPYQLYNMSDLRVANTDFIRCRSISLAYNFRGQWLKRVRAQHIQLKVSMTNPFAWVSDKKWDGRDPETGGWPTRRMTSLSLQMMF